MLSTETKITPASAKTDAVTQPEGVASLPAFARLPINRCNLPAVILGSLTFQQHPTALLLDGCAEFHQQLFAQLDQLSDPALRAASFQDYMRSSFLLDHLDEAGLNVEGGAWQRRRADYLRLLRGWMFDAEGQEAAVLKGWVESRFGLLPRYHQGPLGGYHSEHYQQYLLACAKGLYNTNALEAQIDLLYSYCQYELKRQFPEQSHRLLYRGSNRLNDYELLDNDFRHQPVLLLNNLSSFTDDLNQAESFGDMLLSGQIPLSKLLYFPGLLPASLRGENEYLVIGGVYRLQTLN